ncbi:ABC transporter permease [Paradevosia shaoguanensis]|jgi:peptide/nickel transport system permease protein|uniref:ABC transporter permease n=1 Tax=Paradevosia shaoguanensis TaxID=1335043 RepID=A0AA41QKW2_9HYPH|nr:ABC transporter permease [Paradevosia shaoguanensis]KFL27710.1 peptide ABC transporter permease [Devosia sp. 17-2-E-8]MCF1741565.1 ABC transporter permease [Paradevosia shaoguanensis]MCI0126048.1 ABC transporter permease [Paradevosia shaoguanensis]
MKTRWHPSLVIGLIGTGIFLALALISLIWTPYPIDQIDLARKFAGPGAEHWLGTDFFGRDMLSMVMAGTLTSFVVAAIAVAIGMVIGVPLGLAAAAWGGPVEWLVLRVNDFLFAFPAIITAILITALFGPGAINAMIAIGIFNIPVFARVARGGALSLKSLDYIGAARLAGMGNWEISLRHLLPNVASLIIVQATIQLALGILAEAGLSYVGLGTQPPATSLGLMLKDAQSLFLLHPWLTYVPGLSIVLIVISLNLAGDGLRDMLDPRLKREGIANAAA